jgi:hypothetical protein
MNSKIPEPTNWRVRFWLANLEPPGVKLLALSLLRHAFSYRPEFPSYPGR